MPSIDNYSNLVNNALLTRVNSQSKVSNNNTDVNNTTDSTSDQQKMITNMLFETLLSQLSGDSGNSVASQSLINAFTNEGSSSLINSLSAFNSFNSSIRQTSQSMTKDLGYNANNTSSTLGLRASKYESNLDPSSISNTPGDYGGKSYGAWQFSSKTGSLDSFINSLKETNPNVYSRLSSAKATDGNTFGNNFDAAWKSLAASSKDGFLSLQQNYIKQTYYDKVAQDLKSKFDFDLNQKSAALKESVWSTVVQHGVGGANAIFSKLNLNNNDRNIINNLYNERQKVDLYFRNCSSEVKQGVYNRFVREKQDMLSMLNA